MGDYFEHAFEGLCNSLRSFAHLGEVLLISLIYITAPVWAIPYYVFFKRGDKDGQV